MQHRVLQRLAANMARNARIELGVEADWARAPDNESPAPDFAGLGGVGLVARLWRYAVNPRLGVQALVISSTADRAAAETELLKSNGPLYWVSEWVKVENL